MGGAPKYLRDAIRLSTSASSLRLLRSWTGGSSLSLGLGQPWPYLDPFPLLSFLFGIAFHHQRVLLCQQDLLAGLQVASWGSASVSTRLLYGDAFVRFGATTSIDG